MTEIRRFTDPGLMAARELLNHLRQGEPADIDALLSSRQYTVLMSDEIDYDVCPFDDREHAGQYFFKLLDPLTAKYPDLAADAGLWTWLSLKWMDVLAPVSTAPVPGSSAPPSVTCSTRIRTRRTTATTSPARIESIKHTRTTPTAPGPFWQRQ